jgi:hypothetical protein
MRVLPLKVFALILLCGLCSCKTEQQPSAAPEPTETEKQGADLQTRNNALALLDDLLGNEKNLGKILIIKRNTDELGKLVADISKTAGNGAKMLEALAKTEPGLNLKATSLPPGEAATRKEMSKDREHLLLHSKDAEFQFQLLLTQVEALNYGAHLAMLVAENESQPDRTRDFLRLSAELRELNERVLAMLREQK